MTQPNHPDARGSFYDSMRQIRRYEDTLRLLKEANRIVEAQLRKIDERSAKAHWARRLP